MSCLSLRILVGVSLLSCGTAPAQNVSGTIVGTVPDATGAAVQSVSITVVNGATNVEFKTQTRSTAEYVAPGLPAGVYAVKAESPGFRQQLVKGLTLLPNRTERQDLTLEVGAVQQSVEVAASAPVINSENATIGNIMRARRSRRCR